MPPGGNAGDGGRLASAHPETGRYKEGMMMRNDDDEREQVGKYVGKNVPFF